MDCIKIGCINYEINEIKDLKDNEGNEIFGLVCYDTCEIQTLERLDWQAKLSTLWHEVIHAILVNAGYTDEHDEKLVSAIAHGIYGVSVDNPNMGIKISIRKEK